MNRTTLLNFSVIILACISLGSLAFNLNLYSQKIHLQSEVAELEVKIKNMQRQIDSLEVELQSNFMVSSYITWLVIQRNETRSFEVIIQSLSGFEGNVSVSLEKLPLGVEKILSDTVVHISPQTPAYVTLTLIVENNAEVGIHHLRMEGKVGSFTQFDLVTLIIPS